MPQQMIGVATTHIHPCAWHGSGQTTARCIPCACLCCCWLLCGLAQHRLKLPAVHHLLCNVGPANKLAANKQLQARLAGARCKWVLQLA